MHAAQRFWPRLDLHVTCNTHFFFHNYNNNSYVGMVLFGNKIMATRQPVELTALKLAYNLTQVWLQSAHTVESWGELLHGTSKELNAKG